MEELARRLNEIVDDAEMTGNRLRLDSIISPNPLCSTCLTQSSVNYRPRATANTTRDKRGNTLLSVAAWKNQLAVAELLLTHYKTYGDEFAAVAAGGVDEHKIARSVWRVQPNCRDQKGFTPMSVFSVFASSSVDAWFSLVDDVIILW